MYYKERKVLTDNTEVVASLLGPAWTAEGPMSTPTHVRSVTSAVIRLLSHGRKLSCHLTKSIMSFLTSDGRKCYRHLINCTRECGN